MRNKFVTWGSWIFGGLLLSGMFSFISFLAGFQHGMKLSEGKLVPGIHTLLEGERKRVDGAFEWLTQQDQEDGDQWNEMVTVKDRQDALEEEFIAMRRALAKSGVVYRSPSLVEVKGR